MKRMYYKPETDIHLQEPFHLLGASQQGDGIRVTMSGYEKSSDNGSEGFYTKGVGNAVADPDIEDDGWE